MKNNYSFNLRSLSEDGKTQNENNSQLNIRNSCSTTDKPFATLSSQLSTLRSQLSVRNSQLSTLNSQLSTLNSSLLALALLLAMSIGNGWGQTAPAAFDLSAGNFSFTTQTATNTTYPTNIQGWRNSANNITTAETATVGTDYALLASGTSTTAGISNLGTNGFQFLNGGSGTSRAAGSICVALNTTGRSSIAVSWTAQDMTSGTTSTVMGLSLQYRVGTSGSFTDMGATGLYLSSATSQASAQNFSNISLPAACGNQPVVQIRWIYYTAGTVGTSGRDAIRLDEISVSSVSSASPTISVSSLTAFGSNCINTTAGPNSFNVSGSNLTGNLSIGALSGYTYCLTSNGTYTSTLSITASGTLASTPVYVKFSPTAVQSYNGNIVVSGGGATSQNVSASGSGVAAPTVNAGADFNKCSGQTVTLNGSTNATSSTGSASATYSGGNASTQYVASPTTATISTCPIPLSVTIPTGAVITSVNVSYNIIATGSGYMSDQKSYVRCTSTGGNAEASISSGSGSTTGTMAYNRTNLTIANGVNGGGTINFELHAFQTFTGSGCATTYNYVNNNTFTITVNYTYKNITWSPSTELSASTYILNPNCTATSSRIYTLTVTSGEGCSASDDVTVTVAGSAPAEPTVTATAAQINVGGTAAFSASGSNVTWYDAATGGNVLGTGSSYTSSVQCTAGSTLTVYADDNNGSCSSATRGSASITVRPVIAANPSNALICSSGGSVALSAQLTNASGITWSGSNLSTSSGASTVAYPTVTTSYSLSATVTGCPNINSTQNVGVIEGVSFTPTASSSSLCEGGTSSLNANVSSSNFSVTSITYSPATEPTSGVTTLANAGSAVTTLSGGSLDDGGWEGIPIGFSYNFFGNSYSSIAAGTNGVLMFGTVPGYSTTSGQLGQFAYSSDASNCTPAGASSGQVFPNCNNPANIIALMANDLELDGGSIKYWNDGIAPTRRFIIQYQNVPHYSTGGASASTISAQCILYETTGNVEIHIASAAAGTGNNAKTVGLQNASRTIGATATNRQAFTTAITTPEAWKFVAGATYTYQWSTAGSNISGATSGTYTTPTLNTPGTVTYTVAATNPNTSCASTANVSVTVNARPAAPVSSGNVTACSTAGAQNLVVTTSSGVTADWFAASTGGSVLTSPSSGTGTLSYSIPSPSSTVTYYAEARNSTTGCTSASRTGVTLNVNASPIAPTVTTPVTYCQGATASALTATAGVGNTLKWYTAAPNFPSLTGATLTGSAPTPSTSSEGSTDYFVSQTSGGCESNLAKIVVTINATPATPTASDPSAYCQNASASQLTATAASGCTLYWYTDPTTSAGETTTAPTPSTSNPGTVSYYVANRSNTTSCQGSRKTITVTVNPSITASVTNSASSTSACGGGSITFTATPTNGGASPTYQWYKDNVLLVGETNPTYTLSSPSNGNVIYVAMTPSAQTCLTSGAATSSNEISLTSTASTPTVSIQSTASSAICPGTSVTFSVNSSTNMGATPTYIWKKGGVAISGATNSTYTTTGLVNGDQITLEMTSSLSAGCLNNTSATSSVITTTVNAATAISSQPVATSACLGSNATFSVTASGQGTLTYQWKKAGTNITGNASASTSSLTLSGIASGDAANYSVDVTGSCGTVPSNSVALSINTATSISGQPSAVTQCANTTANFSVTAAGQGTLSYQWKKDGASIGGATNSTLAVSNISSANAGQYTVDVTGGCGTLTSSQALLSVNAATAISSQPSAATICAGNTANFSVTATGTGTLTYQWKREGTNVGTGSTLSVSNAQAANAGNYTVEVSGTCGTATSNNALLTVNPLTSITTQPTASAGCEGQNTTFTVVAAGTAPLSYQWIFGSTNINGATSSTYNIPSTTNANDGSYYVTVSGGCGTVNSSAVNLTVYPTPTANAGTDQTVCPGEAITLTGSGVTGGTYTWNNSVQNGVQFNAPSTTTTYTVTGTSANGCPDTDEVLVTIKSVPTVTISGTSTICIAGSTTLTASGASTYVWSNGSNSAGTTVSPTSTTSYTVTGTGANGCTNTASQSITVNTPSIPYSITGKDYYIWRGATSSDYQVANNWYNHSASNVWTIATSAPTTGIDVIIPTGTCVTNAPSITASSSTADSIIILPSANVTISGSNVRFTVENDVVVKEGGSLTLSSGGILEVRGGSLKFLGNSTFTPNNGTVEMHYKSGHSDAHIISCSGASNNTFYNLNFHGDQVEVGDTAIALGTDITVTNQLNVVSANLRLNGKTLTLGSNATLGEGTNGKKVFDYGADGKIVTTRTIGNGGTSNFGGLGLTITLPSGKSMGSTTIERYTRKNAMISVPDGQNGLDGLGNQPIERFFRVTPSTNGTVGNPLNATLVFNYKTAGYNSQDEANFALYRRASGDNSWEKLEGSLSTNDKTLTVTNFPRFSDVTLGGGGSPLPVELVSFSGACEDGVISLTWQTASEHNSSHFDVEKSRDGENWQLLSTLPSAGTSNELITYQSSDQNGLEGNNYFRLRQVDVDGKEKLYDPINVSCSEVTTGYFSSFPNPSGSAFQVLVNNKELIGTCTLNMVDASGKVIEQRDIEVKDGINMFVINQELTPGIYFLNISNGTKSTPVIRHAIK